jgi:hypothetical protein
MARMRLADGSYIDRDETAEELASLVAQAWQEQRLFLLNTSSGNVHAIHPGNVVSIRGEEQTGRGRGEMPRAA